MGSTNCALPILTILLQDVEVLLPDALGPGVDAELDTILDSLGRVALKQAKLVIEAITRWRRSQTSEPSLPDAAVRHHMPEHVDRVRRLEISERLMRRRYVCVFYSSHSLHLTYVFCLR